MELNSFWFFFSFLFLLSYFIYLFIHLFLELSMCSSSLKAVKSLKVLNGITKKAWLDVEFKKKEKKHVLEQVQWNASYSTHHISSEFGSAFTPHLEFSPFPAYRLTPQQLWNH